MGPASPTSPAFFAMTLDLLETILRNAGNPGAAGEHVVTEMRELTGARTVILLESALPDNATRPRYRFVSPARRDTGHDWDSVLQLEKLSEGLVSATSWGNVGGPAGALLAEMGLALSIAVPLRMGNERIGTLLALGLPGEQVRHEVVDVLDILSTILALVFRNALLYEEQEAIIDTRTKALRESEERYRRMVDQSFDAILQTDLTGRISYVSPSVERTLGYKPEELVGHAVSLLFPGPDSQGLSDRFIFDKGPGSTAIQQAAVLHRNGARTFVEFSVNPIQSGGEVIGLQAILRDVTERKRTEDYQQTLVSLVENASDFIGVSSLDQRVLYVNPAGRRMVGIGPQMDTRQWTLHDFSSPEHADQVVAQTMSRLASGEPVSVEGTFRHFESGEAIPVATTAFVIREQHTHQPLCLGIVARDTREAKRASDERRSLEERLLQSQKLEAIGRLAGGIAHDFNNLLTTILGNADLSLSDLPTADPLREALNEIRGASIRASELTRQLLTFSRKAVIRPRVIAVNGVVEGIRRMLVRVIGEDIRLDIDVDPHTEHVRVDPIQLEQALLNLAINARDAMPQGGVLRITARNLQVSVRQSDQHVGAHAGDYVTVEVSDTGNGMDAETMRQIFEPFFTTKPSSQGTGLGLSIVYGIIHQHGGFVQVDSTVGEGSCFRIHFPRVDGPADPIERSEQQGREPCGTETILLAEDELTLRELTKRMLTRLGYRVIAARDGEQALQEAQAHEGPIELLVTDVVMPGMNGSELAAKLLTTRPELRVLYTSGYPGETVAHHGVSAVAMELLQKPYTAKSLGLRVREILDRKG